MGPSYAKIAHWNDWLFKQGHLQLATSSKRTVDGWLLRLGLPRDQLRKIAAKVPGLLKSRVASAVKSAPTAAIDLEASTVTYERIFDPVGGFRINGTGEERGALRDRLMAELAKTIDPETGQPVVAEVMTREECLTGPHAELAPDVIIVMKPEYGSSDRLSHYSAVVTRRPDIRDPGSHQMNGVFAFTGDDILQNSTPLEGVAIEDIAPTVLHLLGLDVPSDMDGRVLEEIFAADSRPHRSPRYSEPPGRWPSEEEALSHLGAKSTDDEEGVRDRLRALGYFE